MDKNIKEWIGDSEEINFDTEYTLTEKYNAFSHSLAHLRLQENGHNKEEAIEFGEIEADKYFIKQFYNKR